MEYNQASNEALRYENACRKGFHQIGSLSGRIYNPPLQPRSRVCRRGGLHGRPVGSRGSLQACGKSEGAARAGMKPAPTNTLRGLP